MTSIPHRPAGYSTLTPFLCVQAGAAAIDFYVTVFGASVVSRMDLPDGRVAHAELQLDQGRLQLADPLPEYGLTAPVEGPVTHSIAIYVPDVDATTALAADHGATVREPPSTFVTGDRFASVLDPYGHRWSIMTRVEEVSDAEAEQRVADWAAAELNGADTDNTPEPKPHTDRDQGESDPAGCLGGTPWPDGS